MSNSKDDGYRNKYAQFRHEKKVIKNRRKESYKNKNSFMYDDSSSNMNDIPESIYEQNNDNSKEPNKEMVNKDKDDKELNLENEYEEFTPDYFEPVPYVKK
jgi:hypothetical protein